MKHRSPNARCSGANPCKRRLCLEVIVIDCGWVVCVFIWEKGDHVIFFLSRVQRGDGGHPPVVTSHDLVIGGVLSHKDELSGFWFTRSCDWSERCQDAGYPKL